MTEPSHRPDTADMRAVLGAARAVLARDPEAAHEAASGGSCPACTTVAALQFGFTLAVELAGAEFVTGSLRARLLDVIEGAERGLGSPN